MRRYIGPLSILILAAALMLGGACGGGLGPSIADIEGGILDVHGQPGDVVMLQRQFFLVPVSQACCTTAHGCRDTTTATIPEVFPAEVRRLSVPAQWVLFSNITGCLGFVEIGCRQRGPAFCVAPVGTIARGEITIEGYEATCEQIPSDEMPPVGGQPGYWEICNTTTISLQLDGSTVSVHASQGSTASSVALALSNAINNHSVLNTKVAAVASGNKVFVRSLQEGITHSYPWQTSCSYQEEYFYACDFQAVLSPVATLALQE